MEIYQDRYVYLDNMRIILVYFVVFVHIICMFAYPLVYWWPAIDNTGSSRVYENLLMTFDIFMMPHLIFIAAFFIFFSLNNKSTLGYIKKRFFRLFIPIIVFTFCAGDIFYQLLFKRLAVSDPTYLSTFLDYWRDFKDFSAITFIEEGNILNKISYNMNHTWFLSVLFFMTLLVVLFVIPFRKKENVQEYINSREEIINKTISLSIILAIFYIMIMIIFDVAGIDFTSWIRVFALVQVRIDQFFMLLPLFLFGLYMYRKEWLTRGDLGDWKMWGILSAALIFVYVLLFNNRFFPALEEISKVAEHNLMFSDMF